ncbi:hypothetical protein KAR91_29840 [Candidatus Pacearchaeota archaeon]|nr:hypothetical protein [Candidatus Pacearchaeota archaeon]
MAENEKLEKGNDGSPVEIERLVMFLHQEIDSCFVKSRTVGGTLYKMLNGEVCAYRKVLEFIENANSET